MTKVILLQILIISVGAYAGLKLEDTRAAQSFLYGGMIVLLNLLAHTLVWRWIMQKKLIALAVSLIVFKYAIFGVIIYLLLRLGIVEPLWFCLGVASLMITGIGSTLLMKEKKL